MKAAVLHEVGSVLSIEEVTPLPPGDEDVVVRVTASALCRTDLSVLDGHLNYGFPILMGHEACGIVEWTGSAVSGLAHGDRVVGVSAPACGRCSNCTAGRSHICAMASSVREVPRVRCANGEEAVALYGLGAFAEQMTTHQASLVRVDTRLSSAQLALLGCGLTTGMSAVLRRSNLRSGGSIAVVGCGAVGISALQGARVAGASVRVGIDIDPRRREQARQFGATHVLDPRAGGVVAEVKGLTDGEGVDAVIDAVGSAQTFQDAFEMTRRSGSIVLVGVPRPDERYSLEALPFFLSEKRISSALFGSSVVREDIPRFADLAEKGEIDLAAMVTQTVGLNELDEGLRALRAGEGMRTVVLFDS